MASVPESMPKKDSSRSSVVPLSRDGPASGPLRLGSYSLSWSIKMLPLAPPPMSSVSWFFLRLEVSIGDTARGGVPDTDASAEGVKRPVDDEEGPWKGNEDE